MTFLRSIPAPVIALVAIALGSAMDAVIKGATATIALLTIVFFRYLVGMVLVGAPYLALRKPLPSPTALRFHAMRGAAQLSAALLFFYSLTRLGLAEATTIGFTATLMVAPFARVILGEKIHPRAALAALLGFVGVLIAVSGEPPTENDGRLIGILACLGGAATYALTLVMLRARAAEDGAFMIAALSNALPTLYLLPFMVLFGTLPDGGDLPVLVLIGLMGTGLWILMTFAYARAEAQLLAPLDYSALIWSGLLGYVFFSEALSWQLLGGALVIIGACLLVAIPEGVGGRLRARIGLPLPPRDPPDPKG